MVAVLAVSAAYTGSVSSPLRGRPRRVWWPVLPGRHLEASQLSLMDPSVLTTAVGSAATTAAVAAILSASSLPSLPVNDTLNFMVLPRRRR